METKEYKLMYELEESHWWYKGLHDLLFSTIKKINNNGPENKILDAGCGTGFVLSQLNKYGNPFGVDISEIALEYCGKRKLNCVTRASVEKLPFADNFFDLVIVTDVLYHKLVIDDSKALNEIHRVLKINGHLIINEPAHDYMRRNHDKFVHTRHRYKLNELSDKLRQARFQIVRQTYRNAFLGVVLLFFKYFVWKIKKDNSSNLKPTLNILNEILYAVLKIENMLLNIMDMPWGLSVFYVSKKI